ncbi:hypothetical protein C8R46DRAFT_1341958 [Mycena filopes]|nr:hypothetical protein C8R46DRAFT_1341958 [Mycena filopes]
MATPYTPGARFNIYEPEAVRTLPPMEDPDSNFTHWPSFVLHRRSPDRKRYLTEALQMCYEHDIPYREQPDPDALILETELAPGNREERPVQVWSARLQSSQDLLVARIYDPLYFDVNYLDRFAHIDRAVAIEHEAYSRVASYGGILIPHFVGLFVAEIPGSLGPRHVYVILLRHIPGRDVHEIMDHGVGSRTCIEHQAAIIDAAARILYQLFQFGVSPRDLKDNNTILQLPESPAAEDFCATPDCPFRNLIRIDFSFDPSSPAPPSHPYAPQALLIDLEQTLFYTRGLYISQFHIGHCRVMTTTRWSEKDSFRWIRRLDVYDVFEPYHPSPDNPA